MEQRCLYLDALKAIAVIAVVMYHIGFLKQGYLGVDVFLVIAGFLTTRSLADGKNGAFPFILGRVMRLLPLLLLAGTVSMALGWFIMLPDDYENLAESVVATNLFGNNVLSAITTGDYWNIANDYKPLMHTWYVGLLMQIYLVYLLLFYAARLDKNTPKKTLLIIISSLSFLSLLWYFSSTNDANRFYLLPARFYEFGCGGIIALVHEPSQKNVFHPLFSYLCYALLMVLLIVGLDLIPTIVRLPLVVALCAVVVMSGEALENPVTSNQVLVKIGLASYSIYVWHQVLLAFYRYVIGAPFTVWTFILYVAAVGVISWVSFKQIEKGMAKARMVTLVIGALLTGSAGYIYWNSGVVRDVPELGISVQDRHRRMNVAYSERVFEYDRPFTSSDRQHWFVIGNSFGRDFVNVILESDVTDYVEVSYTDDMSKLLSSDRFASADKVFISSRGLSRGAISAIEMKCWANGLSPDNIVIVGEKSFGVNNGHVYAKRHRPDYFDLRVEPLGGTQFLERNKRFRDLYGTRFLDLMALVIDDTGSVQVFTPDHHFISSDGKHFTKYGAKYFAERINWNQYLQ